MVWKKSAHFIGMLPRNMTSDFRKQFLRQGLSLIEYSTDMLRRCDTRMTRRENPADGCASVFLCAWGGEPNKPYPQVSILLMYFLACGDVVYNFYLLLPNCVSFLKNLQISTFDDPSISQKGQSDSPLASQHQTAGCISGIIRMNELKA